MSGSNHPEGFLSAYPEIAEQIGMDRGGLLTSLGIWSLRWLTPCKPTVPLSLVFSGFIERNVITRSFLRAGCAESRPRVAEASTTEHCPKESRHPNSNRSDACPLRHSRPDKLQSACEHAEDAWRLADTRAWRCRWKPRVHSHPLKCIRQAVLRSHCTSWGPLLPYSAVFQPLHNWNCLVS